MELSSDFWESQKGLVLIGNDGEIRFTRTGRARYAARFAKYGFALDNVKTVERFREVMGYVIVGELDANTLEFERLLNDPLTTEEERQLIRGVLTADRQSATVVATLEKPSSPE
jgi:hypothetical protein